MIIGSCSRALPFPIIGCINGPAIGAGFSLALGACDIRTAHTKAMMGMTFVKLGKFIDNNMNK